MDWFKRKKKIPLFTAGINGAGSPKIQAPYITQTTNKSLGFIMVQCKFPLHYKQLLDEVFVISRIIEVEVGVISRSRRLRLITLTETSIILNITKTESNNCFIIH